MAVLGLGAIGGSVAWQATRAGIQRVVGYSRVPAESARALKAGAISEMEWQPAKAVREAELVVVAAGLDESRHTLAALAGRLPPGVVVTNTAAVQTPGMRLAQRHGFEQCFAGSHPLASPRRSGFEGASPTLFRGCVVYVCPSSAGERVAREVAHFWGTVMDAQPVIIEPLEHDRHVAWTRHLPHAVAAVLAKTLAERRLGGVTYSAGVRRTMELAGGDPDAWAEVLLQNAEPMLEALAGIEGQLGELRALLERGDGAELQKYLAAGHAFRDGIEP